LSEDATPVMESTQPSRIREVLDRPLSPTWCALSWLASTGLFVVVVRFLGGPRPGDSAESVYSTWSIAHLNLACAYPTPASHIHFLPNDAPFASVAPLYPLLSSILSAIFRIGHSVAFPTSGAMGVNCSNAYAAIYKWSLASDALTPTLKFAYLGWFVLIAGVIVLLRVTGRGRNGWEVVTLLLLAITPPVYMSVAAYFHPQDLLAMGLILLAVSSAVRGHWTWAGVLLGLSFASQQFALLAIVPLLVIVPRKRRTSFVAAVILSIAAVDGPFVIASSGRALKTVLVGSSRLSFFGSSHFHAAGGTVLFATNLRGAGLFLIARILPVACALGLALWVAKRLGPDGRRAEAVLSLLATALCMRLVFEENLFGYYFMALAVALICVDAVSGRFRGTVITWMGLVMLGFNPIPWFVYLKWEARGINLFMALPVLFVVIALGTFALGIRHHRFRWYLLAASVLVALTCFPPLWGRHWTIHFGPTWMWQIILVPTGLYLASQSLRSVIRSRRLTQPRDVADSTA
jgi:hypothetical protein